MNYNYIKRTIYLYKLKTYLKEIWEWFERNLREIWEKLREIWERFIKIEVCLKCEEWRVFIDEFGVKMEGKMEVKNKNKNTN